MIEAAFFITGAYLGWVITYIIYSGRNNEREPDKTD